MDRLLTPLVARLLSRFVKGAGTAGSDVKASLSGGGVVLHNLELDLTSLFEGLPAVVNRAFSKRLTVAIPWTSLGSQPIQVHLEGVEVILTLRDTPQCDSDSKEGAGISSGPSSHGHPETAEPLLGGGWMGTLTSLLLRTLLDVSVTVSNMVVKLCMPHASANLTSQHMQMRTDKGAWKADVQEPKKWLKKTLHVANVSLSMESNLPQASGDDIQMPLLCLNEGEVSALFPVFAVLERQTEGAYEGAIDLKLAPLTLSVTESRLACLRVFVLGLVAALSVPEGQALSSRTVSKARESLPDDARSLSMFSQRRARKSQADVYKAARSLYGGRASSGLSSAASGAMGTVGAVWSFISAEAATDGSLAPEEAAPLPPPPKLDISVSVSVLAEGAAVLLYRDIDVRGKPPAERMNGVGGAKDAQAWWQALHADHMAAQGGAADLASVATPRKSRFFQDFEEAAASLPVSPSACLPASPVHRAPAARAPIDPAAAMPAPFLALRGVGLGLHARAAHDKLQQLSVTLARCAVQRTVPSPSQDPVSPSTPLLDEVLGLHPVEAVEIHALTQQDGSLLAVRMHWQASSKGGAVPGKKIAVHVGQLSAIYAHGLLTELRAYFSQALGSQDQAQTTSNAAHGETQEEALSCRSAGGIARVPELTAGVRYTDSTEASLGCAVNEAPSQGGVIEEGSAPLVESRMSPPAWLTGGVALSASVLSLQLGVLSSPGARAEAFLVSVERCTVHLGAYRPSARPGSLLAQLLSLHKQAVPGGGLRVALSGIQLCVATCWLHAASRAGSPEAVLTAAGAEAISEPIDFLALVSPMAAAPASSSASEDQETPGSWVASAAVSPVSMRLSGMQLAASLAAALGLQAEIRTGFSQPLKERMRTQSAQVNRQPATWLTRAAFQMRGLWLMHSPAGAVQHAAKLSGWQSDSQPTSICQVGTVAVCLQSAEARAGIAVTVREPMLAAGPDLQLSIPAVELSAGEIPSPPAALQLKGAFSDVQTHHQQLRSGEASGSASADEPSILFIHNIQIHLTSTSSVQGDRDGLHIATAINSASFGMCPSQLAILAAFCQTAASLPALPEVACHSTDASSAVPTQLPVRLSLSCSTLVGQIVTEQIAAAVMAERHGVAHGIALCIHNASVSYDSAISQEVRQHLTLTMGLYEVSALCQREEQGLAFFWLLRSDDRNLQSTEDHQGPQLMLQLSRKVLRSTERAHDNTSLTVQAVAAQLCPAAVHCLQALINTLGKAQHSVIPRGASATSPGASISSATSSIRCSVRRARLDLMTALKEEHAQSTHASSSSSASLGIRIRLCAEDIALMHHSQAQQSQPLGRKDRAALAFAKHVTASALATSATLFGPGLPFRGAPLLLPVDLNIVVETAGAAVHASIVAPLVYTQLSPACIEGLRKLALSSFEPSREGSRVAGPSGATGPAQDSNAATITISSQHLRFDFCTDTAPAAGTSLEGEEHCPLLNPIASVQVSELQATCQSTPSGLRATLSGTVQGSFLDDSTSCFELLLEPTALEVVLQRRPSLAVESMNRNGREDREVEKGSEPLAVPGRQPAGSAPALPGLTLLLRAPAGPLGIRLSEWRLHALRRLLALVLAAQKLPDPAVTRSVAATEASGSRGSSSAVQALSDSVQCDGPPEHPPVITVQNVSGIQLQFGQVGTDECITIADGTSLPYRWRAHPGLTPHAKRLLHLKGSGQATPMFLPAMKQQMPAPPRSETGVESSEERELQWSEAFDAMCSAAHPAVVEVAVGMQAHLAVSTSQVGDTWQVSVQKGHRIVNRTSQTLHVLRGHAVRGSTAEPTGMMRLESQEASAQEILVHRTTPGPAGLKSTCIRVCLGAGWSQALYLSDCNPQAGELAVADSMTGLPGGPAERPLGTLCYQIRAPHAATGQIDVVLWPCLAIRNELPFPVDFLLEQDPELTGIVKSLASSAVALALQSEQPSRLKLRQHGTQEQLTRWSDGLSQTKGLRSSNSILPPLSHHTAFDLPTDTEALRVFLCAEHFEKEVPTVCFVVRAEFLVRNMTEHPLELHFAAGRQILVQPMTVKAANWQPLLERPESISIVMFTSGFTRSQGGSGHAAYHSETISTESNAPRLLALRPDTSDDPGFRLVSVQVQLESREDTVLVGADRGPCETCTVVITPGVYLSNLSSSDLHAAHGSADIPAAPTLMPTVQSQPLPWTWRKRQDSGPLVALGLSHEDCARAATYPLASPDVTAAAVSASMQPHGRIVAAAKQGAVRLRGDAAVPSLAESFVSFLESQAGTQRSTAAESGRPAWPAAMKPGVIDIMQHQGRRIPVVLQGTDGKEVALALRILTALGRIHIVIFHDPQPPVFLSNASSQDMEVCLESSEQRPDGAVTFTAFGQIIRVSAHSEKALFLPFSPGLQSAGDALEGLEQQGTWQSDAEEEEAFLEAVTRQQPSQHPSDLLLKCRWAGAADWACWHVLKEGQSCTTGGMRLATSRHGPSLRVLVSSDPDPPAGPADGTGLPRTAAMQLRVMCKHLRVSLWDDERRIVLGPPVSGAPGTTHEQEALCLYIDSLTGCATFSQPQSSSVPGALALSLEAEALQCDSHLPGNDSVILHSQPGLRAGKPGAEAEAPLQLQLEVSMAGGGSIAGLDMQSCWVNLLSSRIPVLVVAVDDALLTCADRVLHHWKKPGDTQRLPQQDATGSSQSSQQALHALLVEAEARAASAPRLLVQSLSIAPLHLLVDVHAAGGSRHIPITVDTHRAPVTLAGLQGQRLLFWPGVMLQAAAAHFTAEALMNIPRMLGSLELLLNPTGLLTSVSAGLEDLLGLPFAALVDASPAQFVASLGRGPASLLWHVSGWTLTSVSGFSAAASRVIQRNLSARQVSMHESTDVASPGVMSSLRRRAVSAVTLPFDLVSGVTAGIASSTGISCKATPRHSARSPGKWPAAGLARGVKQGSLAAGPQDTQASAELCMRTVHAAALPCGPYIFHCAALEAVVHEETHGELPSVAAVHLPVLVLTSQALLVLSHGGTQLAKSIYLAGAKVSSNHLGSQLQLESGMGGVDGSTLRLQASVPSGMWYMLNPLLQKHITPLQQ